MEVSAQQVLLSLFNAQDTVCLRVFADRKGRNCLWNAESSLLWKIR